MNFLFSMWPSQQGTFGTNIWLEDFKAAWFVLSVSLCVPCEDTLPVIVYVWEIDPREHSLISFVVFCNGSFIALSLVQKLSH